MNARADEIQDLHRCVRDLVAFTALPAVWAGREPRAIAESLADVFLGMLALDLVYVCVQGSPDEVALEAARAARHPDVAGQAQAIGRALAPWLKSANSSPPPSIPHPAGSGMVQLAVIPIGFTGEYGVVAAGSQQADFPTESDRLLLNVGANQVAIWLREARLLAAVREADRLKDNMLACEQAARAALQDSEAGFRALVNAAPTMVWVAAPDGTMTFVTDQWVQYCGLTAEQLARDWPHLVLHPEDYKRCVAQWTQALAQGTPYEIEVRNRRAADGQYRWFLTRAVPARDETGRIRGWYGTTTDIHDRKQAEEASLRLAAIVESSDDAIISKSLDGVVTSWNAAAERIFGYRAEEMIGQPILRLLPEDRHDEERMIIERLRQGERVDHFETVRRTKDGRLLDVSITVSPIRDARGTIIGASKIARDITVQKQLAEELAQRAAELERLNAELQQFAYIASHDLQEPLRTITNYVQLLAQRSRGKLDAETDEFIAFAVDGAKRMQQLIIDLLAYTRVGGKAREVTVVDCEALLARVLGDLQLAIKDSAAEATHDALPTVHGDAGQLGLIFQNLIGNALKFRGAAPPRIHVSARREGAQWVFSVRDNGIGLDPQHAERIFQIFQRLHTRTKYSGTGIGLAICKKVVERHGGRIWVESQPGQGATFLFTISDI
jgi:PAS domain S-box-containing protein